MVPVELEYDDEQILTICPGTQSSSCCSCTSDEEVEVDTIAGGLYGTHGRQPPFHAIVLGAQPHAQPRLAPAMVVEPVHTAFAGSDELSHRVQT